MKGRVILGIAVFLVLGGCGTETQGAKPVVIWHGMGDSCCFSFSMGAIKDLIQLELPGTYVHSIRIGNNEIEDVENSYIGNINEQVKHVCSVLSKDARLKDGYNAVGFSQGAQFLRAVAQRCPDPPMRNLVSIGGQHQGVYGIPNCALLEHSICDFMRRMLVYGAYTKFVQEKLIQASYWHDPLQEKEYARKNLFLADINNAYYVNQTYKENLLKLKNIVLVKFSNDTMVTPTESEWFGFYKPGQSAEVQNLKETDLYRKDRLGLKKLLESGRIHFLSLAANHLQFTETWFVDNIIKKYLT